jgi:hypothetical protein
MLGGPGTTINQNFTVNSNANPQQLARELAWLAGQGVTAP